MAYFDSTKNRALWEIRLTELKQERAARAAGLDRGEGVVVEQAGKQAASTVRVRVTYQQLLKEEAQASRKRQKDSMEFGKERSREREHGQERQREAGGYEKR